MKWVDILTEGGNSLCVCACVCVCQYKYEGERWQAFLSETASATAHNLQRTDGEDNRHLGSMTQSYVLSSWKSSLHVLYLLPAFPTLIRTLLCAFYSPCRYSDVMFERWWSSEAIKMLTLHRVPSIPHTAAVDFYHLPPSFFLLPCSTAQSLWNKSPFHVGEWGKKPRRVSLAHTLSLSYITLNPVLQGVGIYCICRFIKHASQSVLKCKHCCMLYASFIN